PLRASPRFGCPGEARARTVRSRRASWVAPLSLGRLSGPRAKVAGARGTRSRPVAERWRYQREETTRDGGDRGEGSIVPRTPVEAVAVTDSARQEANRG